MSFITSLQSTMLRFVRSITTRRTARASHRFPLLGRPSVFQGVPVGKKKFRRTLGLVFFAGLFLAILSPKFAEVLKTMAVNSQINWLPRVFEWLCLEVLPKVADALLIAPVLALVVDHAAKHNLLSEFARDVSSHIIGRNLPPSLREHIHSYL